MYRHVYMINCYVCVCAPIAIPAYAFGAAYLQNHNKHIHTRLAKCVVGLRNT